MPIEFITFNGKEYPSFQSEGNAARWIMPLAKYYCVGSGLDIGYSKEAWMLPGAIGIEPSIDPTYHALNLPEGEFDYIFSSHMVEHFEGNWMSLLDYWLTKIKVGGILFLYLPHEEQEYWHPKNNRKHVHQLNPEEIVRYLYGLGHNGFTAGPDYNCSFVVVFEKR